MKKLLSAALVLGILAAPTTGMLIAGAETTEVVEISARTQQEIGTITGVVTEVRSFYDTENKIDETKKFITIKDTDGNPTIFLLNSESYSVTGTALNNIIVGDKFSGFYDATLPVILPAIPQYNAVAFAVNIPEPKSVKVDRFDNDLISSDYNLKLNISEDTKIYTNKGELYTGDIKGQRLAVTYTITTRSIPAQTTPEKVVLIDVDSNETVTPETIKKFDFETGKVTEVRNFYKDGKSVKNTKFVTIENSDGGLATFVVSPDSLLINTKSVSKIKVGDTFTGHYDNTKPMIMIYPPQYQAITATVNLKKENIKVDLFDSKLVSSDGDLKIKTGKNTKIVKQNGKAYTGSLKNKNLVVLYGASTKSIPAQTTPSKVIVLNKLK